jgi:hypothetical protein
VVFRAKNTYLLLKILTLLSELWFLSKVSQTYEVLSLLQSYLLSNLILEHETAYTFFFCPMWFSECLQKEKSLFWFYDSFCSHRKIVSSSHVPVGRNLLSALEVCKTTQLSNNHLFLVRGNFSSHFLPLNSCSFKV